MDDSMSSTNYMTKSVSSRTEEDNSSQGSGWTLYLVDLMANNFDDEGSSLSSGCQTSSMVPKAACSAMRKDDDGNYEHVTAASFSLHRCREKLISKRRKTKATFVDQDLEDTASSPVQSPKVNDFSNIFKMSNEVGDRDICQEKGHASASQKAREEGISMDFPETDLRRKGFCLVPMSMLLNYAN